MTNFSILVRLQNASLKKLDALIASLDAQTEPSWELVLLTGQTQHLDRQLAADFAAVHARVFHVSVPDHLVHPEHCVSELEDLGTWTGFMGQNDVLKSACLAEVALAFEAHPYAKVVYTDEEAKHRWGQISAQFDKGAINPLRLRSQEYLRHFTAIQTAWITAVGGFQKLASHVPTHDFYLRTLESQGPVAFVNVPQRLYQRGRDYRLEEVEQRRRDHMVDFDLWGIRQAMARQNLQGTVVDRMGTAEVRYAHPQQPWVTVITTGAPEALEGLEAYRPLKILRVNSVADFHTAAQAVDTEFVCFLDGVPINAQWLHRMMDHVQLSGVGVVGARCVYDFYLHQPGLVNWVFEGSDWNSRGRFNLLAVPHQVSAVSHCAMLVRRDLFHALGGFNTSLPTRFAMDFCIRADAYGVAVVTVPEAMVQVQLAPAATVAEAELLASLHPGWSCRFGLHLSLD